MSRSSAPSFLLSLSGHALLALALYFWVRPAELPEPPKVMQAVLMSAPVAAVSAPVSAPEPTPAAPVELPPPPQPAPPPPPKVEPPKPQPRETPKPAPTARPVEAEKPTPKPLPKVEPPKPAPRPAIDQRRMDDELAEVEAESQRMEKVRRQREAELRQQALNQAMNAEADAAAQLAANARAREQAALIAQYQLAINKKIKSQWRRPPSTTGRLETVMRITLLPGGEVASVVIVSSSGNAAFDASAQEAVGRADPLPVPSDPTLFREQFKVLLLKFKPEE